ncbi:MAG: alpha/beta hydrolase [Actinomycetota bacterium]
MTAARDRRIHVARVLAACALSLVLIACSTSPGAGPPTSSTDADRVTTTTAVCRVTGEPTTVVYRTIPGVTADLTALDVHPVAGRCDAPVVVWVHGGGYHVGDKANGIADKVSLMNGQGWIFVSVNYRLTRPGQPTSAQFPDHYDDVAAAVAWVHGNIEDFGGDPTRIALLGHSAGADIVSNVVINPAYLRGHDLEPATLSCAGPLDTEGFDKAAAGTSDPEGDRAQWSSALGNNPSYVEETSATKLIGQAASIPPIVGVVRGSARRRRIEEEFLEALRRAGVEVTSIDATSLTHEQVSSQIGAPGDDVMTEPLVEFLESCLR